MNYCEIKKADTANGPGIRLSLFVSGCRNHCEGCFQPETWDFHYGRPFTLETISLIINELSKEFYQGITILGGEPMELENQPYVAYLIKTVKNKLPEKDIWIYTGCLYEQIREKTGIRHGAFSDFILDHADVLVDGKFLLEQKDVTIKFRGSRNQRLIDLASTKTDGKIVLWDN